MDYQTPTTPSSLGAYVISSETTVKESKCESYLSDMVKISGIVINALREGFTFHSTMDKSLHYTTGKRKQENQGFPKKSTYTFH